MQKQRKAPLVDACDAADSEEGRIVPYMRQREWQYVANKIASDYSKLHPAVLR
jgi:hypothetical protein